MCDVWWNYNNKKHLRPEQRKLNLRGKAEIFVGHTGQPYGRHTKSWMYFHSVGGGGGGGVTLYIPEAVFWNDLNPLTAGTEYIRVLQPLLTQCISAFKYGDDKTWHQSARFENSWPPFCQIWIIFTHLKLWIVSARHNFKWVEIQIQEFGG